MDDKETIARQAKEIYEMQDRIDNYLAHFESIHSALFSIGAPLNDNVLQFDSKQCNYLYDRISNHIPTEDFVDD